MATLNRIAQLARGEHRRPGLDLLAEDRFRFVELPIDRIDPDPRQPRQDMGGLDDLAASIREYGIIQPLIVSPAADRFLIIAGHRRHCAARLAGLMRVPAVVRTIEEHQRLAVQIVENLHRKDLNAVEEAESFRRLMDEFGLTQRDVAARVGKSLGHINQALRLLDLPPDMLAREKTSEQPVAKTILLEIVKLPAEEREQVYAEARAGRLTRESAKDERLGAAPPLAARTPRKTLPGAGGRAWRTKIGDATLTIIRKHGEPDADYLRTVLRKALKGLNKKG
jgi:ParB family chromosome partitioning protein